MAAGRGVACGSGESNTFIIGFFGEDEEAKMWAAAFRPSLYSEGEQPSETFHSVSLHFFIIVLILRK